MTQQNLSIFKKKYVHPLITLISAHLSTSQRWKCFIGGVCWFLSDSIEMQVLVELEFSILCYKSSGIEMHERCECVYKVFWTCPLPAASLFPQQPFSQLYSEKKKKHLLIYITAFTCFTSVVYHLHRTKLQSTA